MFKPLRVVRAVVAVFAIVAATTLGLTIQKVSAAGVAVTLSPSALTAATPTEVTFSFTPSSGFAASGTVAITAAAGVTIANTCSTPTTDSAAPAGVDGSGSVTGQTYTYTYTGVTNAAVAHSFCVVLTAATGNYGLTFTDSLGNYGGALIYVGNANVVTVTARVNPTLAFQIVQTGDINVTTNTCNLGTLSLAAVNTCDYRLKVTTNSTSGYNVNITSNGDLSRVGPGLQPDTDDIDPIGEATVTLGTEGYGIRVVAGSVTGGTIASQGNFTSDDSSLPTAPTLFLQSNGTNNPSTSTYTPLVTHRGAMDGDTGPGTYQQAVTYTVTANF